MTNLDKCLSQIPLNQSITVSLFLHWFKSIASRTFLFTVSKIALLTRPNSFCAGFMSLVVGLLLKPFLWSFRVIKLLFSPFIFNRFSTSLFLKICFPSILICFLCCCWLFCIWRLQCCLSYDCIPPLLFYRRKWLFYLMITWYFIFNVLFIRLKISAVSAWKFEFQISCSLYWKSLKYYNALSLSTIYKEVLLIKKTIYTLEKLSAIWNRFIYTMEKINFRYSMRNIRIPQNKIYLLRLIEKIEMVIKRMRGKVLCNDKKESNSVKIEWYGLKSSKTLEQVKELIPFENDLIVLMQNVRFRKTRNHFQKKIQKDIQLIKSSDKTVTFNDKITNLYWLTKAEYHHMINNATTSKYKKHKKHINIDGRY